MPRDHKHRSVEAYVPDPASAVGQGVSDPGSAVPACGNCGFRRGRFCRRYPPTGYGVSVVQTNDWCGEWRAE